MPEKVSLPSWICHLLSRVTSPPGPPTWKQVGAAQFRCQEQSVPDRHGSKSHAAMLSPLVRLPKCPSCVSSHAGNIQNSAARNRSTWIRSGKKCSRPSGTSVQPGSPWGTKAADYGQLGLRAEDETREAAARAPFCPLLPLCIPSHPPDFLLLCTAFTGLLQISSFQ